MLKKKFQKKFRKVLGENLENLKKRFSTNVKKDSKNNIN